MSPRWQRVAEARILEAPWTVDHETARPGCHFGVGLERNVDWYEGKPTLTPFHPTVSRLHGGQNLLVDSVDLSVFEETLWIAGPGRDVQVVTREPAVLVEDPREKTCPTPATT